MSGPGTTGPTADHSSDAAADHLDALGSQAPGVLLLVAGHQPPAGRHHPPPRVPSAVPGEEAPHRSTGSGRVSGLDGHLGVGDDVTRQRGGKDGGYGTLEVRRRLAVRSVHGGRSIPHRGAGRDRLSSTAPTGVSALDAVNGWPASSAAVVVVGPGGVLDAIGDLHRRFPLASVTKVLVAVAALVAIEEGSLWLDEPAGPAGATVRHLLGHASGLGPDGGVLAAPGTQRIYSNAGFEELADMLGRATNMPFASYLTEGLLEPLGLGDTTLEGSPAHGGISTSDDLARLVGELLDPTLVDRATLAEATDVCFPGLDGVLPGFGRQRPNDWGLGFERRGQKSPHWTGSTNAATTFGHFGRTGTFLWVDPVAQLACVCLTDAGFGPWAVRAWPALSDAILAEHRPDPG